MEVQELNASNITLAYDCYIQPSVKEPPFSPEFALVVSMQANLASRNEISCLIKNCSRASMISGADREELTALLIGINPMKSSDSTLLKQNVA